MRIINEITDEARQKHILTLDDGSSVDFELTYIRNQKGWFYSASRLDNFSVVNQRLVTSPNMIRKFKNIIPFGFACTASDGYEPINQDDFSTGRATFFLLNEEDVIAIEAAIHV